MSAIPLRDDLVEKLQAIARRENRPVDDVVAALLDQYADDDEAAWEEAVVRESLGDALKPDGSIDFNILRAGSQITTLDELFPEGSMDDEA
jgi:hypothetical protein